MMWSKCVQTDLEQYGVIRRDSIEDQIEWLWTAHPSIRWDGPNRLAHGQQYKLQITHIIQTCLKDTP